MYVDSTLLPQKRLLNEDFYTHLRDTSKSDNITHHNKPRSSGDRDLTVHSLHVIELQCLTKKKRNSLNGLVRSGHDK